MMKYNYTAAFVDKDGQAAVVFFQATTGSQALEVCEIVFSDTSFKLLLGGTLSSLFADTAYPTRLFYEDCERLIKDYSDRLQVEEGKKQNELYVKYAEYLETLTVYMKQMRQE